MIGLLNVVILAMVTLLELEQLQLAHEARLEDHLIQTLGRWSSDCYTRYIHTSPKVIQQAQKQLAKTDQSIVFNVLY